MRRQEFTEQEIEEMVKEQQAILTAEAAAKAAEVKPVEEKKSAATATQDKKPD